ncbi:hypothetical protein [Marinobacterium mangrovicola]|uniref:Cobalt-zinc-cadmium efflux system protein n=1 Tax=Marinobacterium mangrovicola TaxID=1476959 RepID=A0A4R1G3V3_9GAMM|nr:hypothetical protein [Marinobacterium mangrovicola]TCK02354.1 hypothetical protein CLV83_4539 [Marinobacterium mangrovicola]
MTRLTRTSLALLFVLLFNLQSLSALASSVSGDQAVWQHWQFHKVHGGHSHSEELMGDQAEDDSSENLLHIELSQASITELVIAVPLTDSIKVPSRPMVLARPSHNAPHLGIEIPPPIA